MKTEDLAFVADALLTLCEKSPIRPFYTERAYAQKLKRDLPRERLYAHLASCRRHDELLKSEYEEIFDYAALTQRQAEVLAKRLEGFTFDEIGTELGHTKQNAQNVFIQAVKKLARAFHVYPYRGLSDTYRRETNRGCR